MPRWSNREELVAQILQLRAEKMTQRAVARALGISRNTVRKLERAHSAEREVGHRALPAPPKRAPRASKLDSFRPAIADLLKTYPEITAQRVFEEIATHGYTGAYTGIRDHVRSVRPRAKPEPSYTTPNYGPGQMAESDWSPYTIDFQVQSRSVVQAFAYVLNHSRRKSFALFERADLHALMDGHVGTFERFKGAAHRTKYDSQKPVVLSWEGQQPIYNPRFLAFCTYYEFRPEACRRFHPNDKPHVERAFWELERSFLNGRQFRDLEDMRAQLAEWQDTICDSRPHKKTKRPPIEMFAEEAPHLVPLPRMPYDTARVIYRLASMDGFVAWDGNRYAVPYEHITDILPIRVTEREIWVYAADLRLVARHELAPKSAGQDIGGSELHPKAQYKTPVDLEQLKAAFDALGDTGTAFFSELLSANRRQAGHQARQILLLRERFTSTDIAAALGHARSYGALDHHAVSRILAARAQPRKLEEYVTERAVRRWAEADQPPGTEPRDLTEYDTIPSDCEGKNKESQWPSDPPMATTSSSDSADT